MSTAYDPKLRQLAKSIAKEMGFESFTQEGVYSMMVGPNFETVSEARFLQIIGVDATGKILLCVIYVLRLFGLFLLFRFGC